MTYTEDMNLNECETTPCRRGPRGEKKTARKIREMTSWQNKQPRSPTTSFVKNLERTSIKKTRNRSGVRTRRSGKKEW